MLLALGSLPRDLALARETLLAALPDGGGDSAKSHTLTSLFEERIAPEEPAIWESEQPAEERAESLVRLSLGLDALEAEACGPLLAGGATPYEAARGTPYDNAKLRHFFGAVAAVRLNATGRPSTLERQARTALYLFPADDTAGHRFLVIESLAVVTSKHFQVSDDPDRLPRAALAHRDLLRLNHGGVRLPDAEHQAQQSKVDAWRDRCEAAEACALAHLVQPATQRIPAVAVAVQRDVEHAGVAADESLRGARASPRAPPTPAA